MLPLLIASLCTAPRGGSAEEPPAPTKETVDAPQAPLENKPAKKTRLWLAATEIALSIGAGTAWYWIDRERQVADWDFPSVKQRVTLEAWRYDNNPFAINYAWHAFSGAGYHVFSRANGLGLWSSVAVGVISSSAWEFLFEFREKVSINDMIFTPTSGAIIGEFAHRLGAHVARRTVRNTWQRSLARWTLGLPHALGQLLDGQLTDAPMSLAESSSASSQASHAFTLAVGAQFGNQRRDASDTRGSYWFPRVSASGRIASLRRYLHDGTFSAGFSQGELTQASLVLGRANAARHTEFTAETIFAGIHWQDIRQGMGKAHTLGVAAAFQYRRQEFDLWRDRLAILHLPGLAFDMHRVSGPWTASVRTRLHGDFAGIHAINHDRWRAANDVAQDKTILRKQGYYYGWGGSLGIQAELTGPWLSCGVSASAGAYNSDEGLDRNQEDLAVDTPLRDSLLQADVWAQFSIGPMSFIRSSLNWTRRQATQGDLQDTQSLLQGATSIGISF